MKFIHEIRERFIYTVEIFAEILEKLIRLMNIEEWKRFLGRDEK